MGPALGSGLGVARGVVAVRRSGAASYSGPPQPRQTAGRQDLRRLSVRGAAACPECRGQDPRRRGHSWHQGGRLDTLQHPTSSGGDHMYAFISSLGSDGSSAAGAAPAAAGAADAAGADSVFCSLTMRDRLGPRTDLLPNTAPCRRGALPADQSVSQSVITTLLPTEHMVPTHSDLLHERAMESLASLIFQRTRDIKF